MDDGGQRLLDVIEDTHVLETFLRESFSSSGLDDASRYDHGGNGAENCLSMGAGLENFMFDGQLVDPLRSCPPHPSHHGHQVSPHILQGVLHPPNITSGTTNSTLPIHSHQSHHHHPHHQHHHQNALHSHSHLTSQHHTQLQHHHQSPQLHSNHPVALHTPIANNLESDCLTRTPRDPCGLARNDPDHTLQQLLASSPALNSSQQLVQLHQQSQLPLQHQSNSHLHQLSSHTHNSHGQNPQSLQSHSVIPTSSLPATSTLHPHLYSQISHPHGGSLSLKSHHTQQTPVPYDTSNTILHMGVPPLLSSSNINSASNLSSHNAILKSESANHSQSKLNLCSSLKTVASTTTTNILRPSTNNNYKVNLLEAQNHVLSTVGPVFSSSEVPAVSSSQSVGSTQSNDILTCKGQIHPKSTTMGTGSSRIFPIDQTLNGCSVVNSNAIISQKTLSGSVSRNISAPTCVYGSTKNSINQSSSSSATSKVTEAISASSSISSFAIPNKSPSSSLPRASPSPSYSGTTTSPRHASQSPASYPAKSPAPSPHSQTLKSPVTPLSPIQSSQSTQTAITSNSLLPSRVLPSVGLVSHMPISQGSPNTGLVLTPSGTTVQVAPSIKQVVPSGQVIQLVSSHSNQSRQAITIPHPKPIQPKQPQLLPKPLHGQTVRQSTPPPPAGKTLIGPRPIPPNTQPIVLGASSQPTVIAGQQSLGGLVLNSSLLQTGGLQQPILIPQANGVQLLVRPLGQPANASGQALLVPMPNQPQGVSSVNKAHQQPPTLMIPGSGQTPAIVIPQGLSSSLGNPGVLSAAQATRPTPQPIIRFVAPQAPLQLQQINTPTGPMFVAVPINQTALNLSATGMFATSSPVRALAPQVTPNTLQISTSLNSVNLNQLQIASAGLHSTSADQIPSNVEGRSPASSTASSRTDGTFLSVTSNANNGTVVQSGSVDSALDSKNKKKAKKKKKDTREDKNKNKSVSINLNELLKETGIFDENEFSGLGIEDSSMDTGCTINSAVVSNEGLAGSTALGGSIVSSCTSTPLYSSTETFKISTSNNNQLAVTSPITTTVLQNSSIGGSIFNLNGGNVDIGGSNALQMSNMQPGMCLTLDASGKLVLGEAVKPPLAAISVSLGSQVFSTTGPSMNSAGPILISNSEALRPAAVSKNAIFTLGDGVNARSCLIKIDNSAASPKGFGLPGSVDQSKGISSMPVIVSSGEQHSKHSLIITSGTDFKSLGSSGGAVVVSSSSLVDHFLPSSVLSDGKGNFLLPTNQSSAFSSSSVASSVRSPPPMSVDSRASKKLNNNNKKKKKDKESPSATLLVAPDQFSPNKGKRNIPLISNGPPTSSKVISSPSGPQVSNGHVSVTSNSIVSTLSSSEAGSSVAVSGSQLSTLVNGHSKVSTPFGLTSVSAAAPSTGFVIQPGHQVKQLILSPQNQEALKRVHTQIQELQAKKGHLREQDKVLQQKLIAEYKKIMATGTPVPVCHALAQPIHNLSSSVGSGNSHSSVKYSHSVGHKKILFTPAQKKGFLLQTKKNCVDNHSGRHSSSAKTKIGDSIETNKSGVSSASPLLLSPSSLSSPTNSTASTTANEALTKQLTPRSFQNETNNNLGGSFVKIGHQSSPDGLDSSNSSPLRGSVSASMPIIVASPLSSSMVRDKSGASGDGKGKFLSGIHQTVLQSPTNTTNALDASSAQPEKLTSTTQSPSSAPPFSLPLTRDQLFEHQLRTDQTGARLPDYKTPFKSKIDACKRLIRYHVFDELRPTSTELADTDAQFEVQAEVLLRKMKSMKHKYQSLLLKDSMRRHPSSETAMLYRLFVQEERHSLERLKLDTLKGKEINFPPLPKHWFHPDPPGSPEPPYPWELEWSKDKVYLRTHSSPPSTPALEVDPLSRVETPLWELEGEGRLQIMMDEEEEHDDVRWGGEGETAPPDDLPCPVGDSFSALEAEVEEEYLDDRVCGSNAVLPESPTSISQSLSNATSLSLLRQEKNDLSPARIPDSSPRCPSTRVEPVTESDYASTSSSLIGGSYCHPAERHLLNNCDERAKKRRRGDGDRQSPHYHHHHHHAKKRQKGRRSPTSKIKIRLKGEENASVAVVPPLRIRSDRFDLREGPEDQKESERDNGSSAAAAAAAFGGLKLTLKKQEGSQDYYYRVEDEPNGIECGGILRNRSPGMIPSLLDHPMRRRLETTAPVNGRMKDVSVVLEDCLQPDPKTDQERLQRHFDEEEEEDTTPHRRRHGHSKREKRLKSRHFRHSHQALPNGLQLVPPSLERKKENVSKFMEGNWQSQGQPMGSPLFYDPTLSSHIKHRSSGGGAFNS